jgi:hypothetical protein
MSIVVDLGLSNAASLFGVLFALSTLALSFCALPILALTLFWLG